MIIVALLAIMELFSGSMTENSLQAAPDYTSYIGKIYSCKY